MPEPEVSTWYAVQSAGPLMMLYLVMVLAWVAWLTVTWLKRKKWRGQSVGVWFFPLAFGLIALARLSLAFRNYFADYKMAGPPDPWETVHEGLIVTQASLAVSITGMIALLINPLLICFCKSCGKRDDDDQ